MKRPTLAALAAAILFPGSLFAQNPALIDRPAWGPRLLITPFAGFAPAVSRLERWNVQSPGGSAAQNYDVELGTGMAAGVSMEFKLIDRFVLIGSGTFVTRGKTRETAQDAGGVRFEHQGSNFIFAKAALAIRLREAISELQVHELSGSIFVGPAFVRETPKSDVNADDALLEPLNHYGVNFGVDAQIPLPYDRLSFQFGLEDTYLWWNTDELARRNDAVFAHAGMQTVSRLEADPSHNFILRAGLSFALR